MAPTIMLTAAEKEIDSVHLPHVSGLVSVPSSEQFVFPRKIIFFFNICFTPPIQRSVTPPPVK